MTDPWIGAENKYGPGTPVTGRVSKVESFGAFIEVEEGVEGLLPVSEISYQRIRHPSEIVKEGDTLRLVVLSLEPGNRRMSFSLKQAGPDPWKTVGERYAVDMTVKGTVTRVVDFGAFVELEPGLEGLIHISELANNRVRSANDIVKPSQAVSVRVLEVGRGRPADFALVEARDRSAGDRRNPAGGFEEKTSAIARRIGLLIQHYVYSSRSWTSRFAEVLLSIRC